MSSLKILEPADAARLKEVEKAIGNKFSWAWLERPVTVILAGDNVTTKLGDYMKKVDVPGKVLCQWCDELIKYGSKGSIALVRHAESKKHMAKLQIRRTNYSLGSNAASSSKSIHPYFSSFSSNTSMVQKTEPVCAPIVPICDRVSNMQVTLIHIYRYLQNCCEFFNITSSWQFVNKFNK